MLRQRMATGLVAAACLAGACGPSAARGVDRPASPSPAPSPPSSPLASSLASQLPPAPAPAHAAPGPSSPPSRPSGSCPPSLAGELANTARAGQLVTVVAPSSGSTTAAVTLWERSDGCWAPAGGPWPGRVGESGVSDHHREGDGSTPTGAYGIGPVIYGIAPDPGVRYRYHRLVCGDWWDEDPPSPTYNTFQHVACGTRPPFHGDSEALWEATVAYQHFVVVDYNAHPAVPSAGSAVFIHDDTGRPTIGCVSLPAPDLLTLLRWLDPARSPLVVIGTEAEIRHF